MPRDAPADIEVVFIRATSTDVLVADEGEYQVEAWLPRVHVTTDSDIDHLQKGEVFEITVPEWLAYEKGLI